MARSLRAVATKLAEFLPFRSSGRVLADDPPAAPTAPPAPSRPKTCHAASAFSSRRIPPAKSCIAAASSCPLVPHPRGRFYQSDRRKCAFIQCFLKDRGPFVLKDFLSTRNEPDCIDSVACHSKRAIEHDDERVYV